MDKKPVNKPQRGQALPGAIPFTKGGEHVNPSGKATRLKTLVTIALREKLASMDLETKQTCAERIADIWYQCITHPDPEVDKTKIMAMESIVDRVEGRPKQQLDVNDVTQELRARPDADLLFHLAHGHWPEETEESVQ